MRETGFCNDNHGQTVIQPDQRSWKQSYYQAVRDAARALGIQVSGVHRLRANYAQNLHDELLENGKSDREAQREVSKRLGHNRV